MIEIVTMVTEAFNNFPLFVAYFLLLQVQKTVEPIICLPGDFRIWVATIGCVRARYTRVMKMCQPRLHEKCLCDNF